jgi:hypothetical protein
MEILRLFRNYMVKTFALECQTRFNVFSHFGAYIECVMPENWATRQRLASPLMVMAAHIIHGRLKDIICRYKRSNSDFVFVHFFHVKQGEQQQFDVPITWKKR